MAQQAPNFGDTQISTTIQPGSAIVNPAQDDSGKYIAKAVDAGATGLGQVAGDIFQQMNYGNSAKLGNTYRQQLLQIADAQSQGIISMTTAGTRARLAYAQATASNPALADTFDKINSSVLGDTGLAHVIVAGTPEDQAKNEVVKSAYAAGYGKPDGSVDTDSYLNVQRQTATTAAAIQQIDAKSKALGYVTDVDKANVHQQITALAKQASPWVYNQIDNLNAALAKTTDPTQRAQLIDQFQQATNSQFAQWGQAGDGLEDTAWLVKPLQDAVQLSVDAATGKTTQSVADAQIASIKSKAQLALIQGDPQMAKLVAASALLGQAGGPILDQAGSVIAARIFAENSQSYDTTPGATNPTPADVLNSNVDTQKSLKILDSSLKNGITSVDPQVQGEVNNQLTNLMRSVGKGSNSPTDFTNVINFFASNSVASWIKTGKTIVPPDIRAQATQSLADDYQKAIIPAVINRWDERSAVVMSAGGANPVIAGGSTSSPTVERHAVNELVDPVWDGSSLSFKAKPQYASNASVAGLVKQLNTGDRSLALPINNLIRAAAHMSGDTDYTKMYQRLAPQLFSSGIGPDGKSDIGTFEPPKDTTGEANATAMVTKATPIDNIDDVISRKGTLSYVNNNPGNIRAGSFTEAHGAIGENKGFAVFKSYEDGRAAQQSLLTSPAYKNLTVQQAISKWAPPSENNTGAYVKAITDAGLPADTPISSLSPAQMNKLLDAIQAHEGWKAG